MTLNNFTELIGKLIYIKKRSRDIDHTFKISLIDYDEEFDHIIYILLKEIFTSTGLDWIDWYLYERPSKSENGIDLKAFDENNNQICYDIPSLYNFLLEQKYFK